MSAPLGIFRIVTRFGHLRQLAEKARDHADLNDDLRRQLPTDLAPHVRLATVNDGCLVLQADSPAWAARLRFKTPEILENLRLNSSFAAIRSIRIRNDLGTTAPAPAPIFHARLGEEAVRALEAQAACTSDPQLRAAFERLASRGKPRQ
jgi:hypothetical protein